MGTLDASIVNISLPTMACEFHGPLGGAVKWVVIAYLSALCGAAFSLWFLRVRCRGSCRGKTKNGQVVESRVR